MAADDPEERTLVDLALDVFLYAPVGLALEAREVVPKLAERGRGQVALARLLGQVAVRKGQREAERFMARGADPAPTPTPEPGPSEQSSSPSGPPEPVAFPIDGYDDLRAADIVPLLNTLDLDELAVVEAHEAANRGRRTVLGRIEQLRT